MAIVNRLRLLLARDKQGAPVPLMTDIPIAVTRDATITSSTTVTFDTTNIPTILRLQAFSGAVYLRWGSTAVTNANYHLIIPEGGQPIDYPVPLDPATGLLYTTCRVLEKDSGAEISISEMP